MRKDECDRLDVYRYCGALVFLISAFTFSQRNWKGGLFWLLVGVAIIALLTYLDKPSANLWR